MALSLESIYKPVNDFFFEKFKHEEDAPIAFRLEKFGSEINIEDFMELNDPEEEFSDFVNKVPVMNPNSIHVDFLMNNIDDTYAQIFNAIPSVPDEFDTSEKEHIEENFIKAKAKALKDWEAAKKVRSGGIADWFIFSDASPENWFADDSNTWEERKFEIKQSTDDLKDSKNKANLQILKIRMTDKQLGKIMPVLKAQNPAKPIDLSKHVIKMNPKFKTAALKPISHRPTPMTTKMTHINVSDIMVKPRIKPGNINRPQFLRAEKKIRAAHLETIHKANASKKSALGNKFSKAFHGLKLNQKILVKDYIKQKSPSKPVNTNLVRISFKYCVVKIRRSWFNESMCYLNKFWHIPGMDKGELIDPKINSGAMPYLPIAFVAVKDLKIVANWHVSDKETLKQATSFGPFDINNQDIDEKGSLSHDGTQVIGWMLQKMPVLPPN